MNKITDNLLLDIEELKELLGERDVNNYIILVDFVDSKEEIYCSNDYTDYFKLIAMLSIYLAELQMKAFIKSDATEDVTEYQLNSDKSKLQ